MNDLFASALALLVLFGGVGACLWLHRVGVASTYTRDLLHVGAGVWVLLWPLFDGDVAPLTIVGLAALATWSVPGWGRRYAWAGPSRLEAFVSRVHDTFASGDERWSGLSLYVLAFALFTVWGRLVHPFAAAAALLALSLGDGVGGMVGRAVGAHHFRAPGGKKKSVEGSLVVALAATVGVLLAAARFEVDVTMSRAVALGVAASFAEAASPRGTDNLVVPLVVWGAVEAS